jgi:hypothetical protein
MRIRELQGNIERRLLVNYRVDADVATRLLPEPFRPQLVGGVAVAGICLLRLGELRPQRVPRALGRWSENAAHRIAVEWDTPEGTATGVYIPRRDTESILNQAVGGRVFPGEHHRARFHITESDDRLRVEFESHDGSAFADVSVEVAAELESDVFADLATASRFFEAGGVGYSATSRRDRVDGLELRTHAWRVAPARVMAARSSFFDDPGRFPAGSATLDCALLMRNVPATWHALRNYT